MESFLIQKTFSDDLTKIGKLDKMYEYVEHVFYIFKIPPKRITKQNF